jgi:uncharacterized protein involved in exopolysaccharide biosynthesis
MAQLTPAEEAQLAALRARRGQVVQEIERVSRDLVATQRSIKTLQDRLIVERDQAAKDLFIANRVINERRADLQICHSV